MKITNSKQSTTPIKTVEVCSWKENPKNQAKNSLRPIAPNDPQNKNSCDTNHL